MGFAQIFLNSFEESRGIFPGLLGEALDFAQNFLGMAEDGQRMVLGRCRGGLSVFRARLVGMSVEEGKESTWTAYSSEVPRARIFQTSCCENVERKAPDGLEVFSQPRKAM